MLLGVERLDQSTFLANLQLTLQKSGEPELLVFIHGYNVSFASAAQRSAQIVRDIKFRGQAVLYSWPSNAETIQYAADEAAMDASWRHFSAFLQLLLTQTSATNVHVIAHSMGNRALVRAIEAMDTSPPAKGSAALGEIVFAAPDVDRDEFVQIASRFSGRARSFTIYASRNDWALGISKLLHKFPRAGDAGDHLIVRNGIDTIDASMADISLFGLGHSYFADQRTILSDLHGLIINQLPPDRRFDLQPVESTGSAHWSYRE
jgi:esterase/lipase superfamily enzyme